MFNFLGRFFPIYVLGFILLLLGACGAYAQADSRLGRNILKATGYDEASHRKRYRFMAVSSPVRRGARAQRFEIRHGDCGRSSGWNDCGTDRQRIERKERPKNKFSNPNRPTWYGYSVLAPSGFSGLGDTSVTISQVKTENMLVPIWWIAFRDGVLVANFANSRQCVIGRIANWSGKWVDLVVYANYGKKVNGTSFAVYVDGGLACARKGSLIPESYGDKPLRLGFKYGVYLSFVSRWLQKNSTKPVSLDSYQQDHEKGASRSPTGTPFKYDWGVKIPTLVFYFDEMRSGPTREAVDVRVHEKLGIEPVD